LAVLPGGSNPALEILAMLFVTIGEAHSEVILNDFFAISSPINSLSAGVAAVLEEVPQPAKTPARIRIGNLIFNRIFPVCLFRPLSYQHFAIQVLKFS
jgi:hypothetical protein